MEKTISLAEHRKGILAIVLAAVVWSSGGLFIKLLPFDALTILFYRSGCAALLFAAVYRQQIFRFNKLSLMASGFYCCLLIAFVSSTKLTTAANAIFLQYTAPIYVLLLEPLIFRSKIRKPDLWCIAACMLGMFLFFGDQFGVGSIKGNLLGLLSGITLAGFILSQRLNTPDHHFAAIFWGNILVLIVTYTAFAQAPTPNAQQWAMLLFLGFVQIGIGYMAFTYGLNRSTATESSLLAMLEPILNPIWVMIGYGETPSLLAGVGGGIILTALALRTLYLEKAKRKILREEPQ